MTDTRTRLAAIVEELLGTYRPVTDESRLGADLGADSLDVVEVVMTIEDEFRVEIADDEWPVGDATFGAVVALVEQKLSAGAAT